MQFKAYLKLVMCLLICNIPKSVALLIIKTVLLDYKNTKIQEYKNARIQEDMKDTSAFQ